MCHILFYILEKVLDALNAKFNNDYGDVAFLQQQRDSNYFSYGLMCWTRPKKRKCDNNGIYSK